ncbi:MAG: DUF3108 domain-containing protein [Bacteroidetes bacterium]|nr:DUF3108 domain-containing protein [Bacteroidota bacterium]
MQMKRGFLRNHVSRFFSCALLLLLLQAGASAQQGARSATGSRDVHGRCTPNFGIFVKGERLDYEVSYMGIALGMISSRIVAVDSVGGKLRVQTEALIRTYRGVPFVTLNTLFQSRIGASLQSTAFRNKEYIRDDTVFKYIDYHFPSGKDAVIINETLTDKPGWYRIDTLDLEGKQWQDGLSLLFYARAYARTRCEKEVPVLMYRSKAITTIRFGIGREEEEIDALEHPVRTVKLDGETGFTGIFGLTGGFEGWFSDDSAAVPITAKMHVLIGSVRIELVKWKRSGWSPPIIKD